MKKLIYCALALAAGLFASSCQQENLEPVAQGNTVTYTVELPGVATKAIGDATNVNQLIYEVWRTGNAKDITLNPSAANAAEPRTELLYRKTAVVNNRIAKFEVDLVKDQNYTILFWAHVVDAEGVNAYYNTGDLRSVALKDKELGAFDEARAAFYGIDFIEAGKQKAQQKVTLTRPFAQVNLGTVERNAEAMGYSLEVNATSVTIYGASTKFNVATGVASAETADCADLTFASDAPFMDPVEKLNGTYEWIAMDYIFVPANQATLAVDYTITTNHGVVSNSISNLPTQKNYRTNIIGNLLTSKTDYIVELDKNWAGADIMYEIWDGKTISAPAYDETTKTYTVENGAQLAWIAEQTKVKEVKGFEGKTIVLAKNINLGGHEWTPIGTNAAHFQGSFDGKGYAIEDLRITARNTDGAQAALFGTVSGSPTFANLTIANSTIVYPGEGDFYGAALIGTAYGNLSITNVTVKNCDISGNNKVAGILAHDGVVSSLNIDNCHVIDSKIASLNEEDGGNVGGLIGVFQGADNGSHVIKNSSVRNTEIIGINSSNTGKRANSEFVACIIRGNQTLVIEDCELSGNTFTQNDEVTYVSPFGAFVGGDRADGNNTCTVIVDDEEFYSVQVIPTEIDLGNGKTVVLAANSATQKVLVKGQGTLILNGTTITTTEGPAIELAEGANVTLRVVNGNVKLTGATDGILANVATLSVTGTGNLEVVGKAGSGINGSVTIDGLAHITSKGNGDHAYGIGGIGAKVVIENTIVDYACGGHIQPLFANDMKYGKSEPEGGAAIGGATVKIKNSTITKVDGGSKAAAIGERFWQSTSIEIVDSRILEANGGNASAGIGGSRYGENDKYNVSIKIQNSTVTATGGQHGAGIGSGYDTHCNGQNYTAENKIEIDEKSVINAKGGKYAAGIGTGFHSAYLTGSIAAGATINAESGEAFYKDSYTTAQNIGYGVVDPAREFSGENKTITFTVAGTVIGTPYGIPVAKVGNTEYKSIDEAIAAWTNGTTLTLLANVTLSDVIKISSTEMHTLDLGTYTLTGAKGKNAIEIINNGRASASYALDIKADSDNPGGITASSAVVKTTGKSGVKDRPIIRFYNGVFNANNIINHGGSSGTNSPQFIFYNGVYNGNITTNRAICTFEGGTFNGKFFMSVDSSSYARIGGGKFKYMDNLYGSALNADKFTIGSAKGVFDRGVYVDDEGYIVVGGPVITEFGDKFAAKTTKISEVGSYLLYSSAAEYGVYYTNAQMAIYKHKEANVDLK